MAVSDEKIEEAILLYMKDSLARGDTPTRGGAIRQVTGDFAVLPSGVAKVITKMLEARTIQHINNDALRFTPQPTSGL